MLWEIAAGVTQHHCPAAGAGTSTCQGPVWARQSPRVGLEKPAAVFSGLFSVVAVGSLDPQKGVRDSEMVDVCSGSTCRVCGLSVWRDGGCEVCNVGHINEKQRRSSVKHQC